jgi:hypothetical protein
MSFLIRCFAFHIAFVPVAFKGRCNQRRIPTGLSATYRTTHQTSRTYETIAQCLPHHLVLERSGQTVNRYAFPSYSSKLSWAYGFVSSFCRTLSVCYIRGQRQKQCTSHMELLFGSARSWGRDNAGSCTIAEEISTLLCKAYLIACACIVDMCV